MSRAITFTAREQAELIPVERDTAPLGPREIAGRMLVSLVSTGTELAVYQGAHFPARPGYAAVAQIERVGKDVSDIKAGDRVLCLYSHQSHLRVPREDAVRVPDGLAPEVAAFARMMGVSMSTLTTTAARPPELVVVAGLGLVGNLAAQVFAACGYRVVGCEPDARRRDLAKHFGIEAVFPAVPLDDPDIAGKVGLVLECSGHEQAVLDGCRVVRKRGEVVLVGVPWRRRTEIFAHDVLDVVFHNYVIVRGGWEWDVPRQPTDFRINSIYGNLAAALRWLAEGRVRAQGLYAVRSPRDCQAVYQELLHGGGGRLTTVFDWGKT